MNFPLSRFAKNNLKGVAKGLRRGSRGESILLPPSGLGWSPGVEDVEETEGMNSFGIDWFTVTTQIWVVLLIGLAA